MLDQRYKSSIKIANGLVIRWRLSFLHYREVLVESFMVVANSCIKKKDSIVLFIIFS